MSRTWVRIDVAALLAAMLLASGAPAAAQEPFFPGVSLKILDESAPAGAMVQMKLFVTEPRPITTGGGRLAFNNFFVEGISLLSPGHDTLGIAVLDASGLSLSFVSPSGTLGTDPDYPVLTVAGRVAATTPAGSELAFDLDAASLQLFDASGVAYPTTVANGVLAVGPNLSISDVRPGSGSLDAGGVATIVGSGFGPRTKVNFSDTLLSEVRFVDPTRLDVVLAQPAAMHGMRVRASDRNGGKMAYFSYQRTTPAGLSRHPVLARAVPLFPPQTLTLGVIDLSGASSGLALQNIGASDVDARADLLDSNGTIVSSTTISVPAARYIVREISEIFHTAYSPSSAVRISARSGIQMMGIAIDEAGGARPLQPR